MLITTKAPSWFGFGAITIWPFILIVPSLAGDKALVEHELVHYREQRKWLCLPWWVAYLVSRKFRFNAEVRGHAAQIKHGGCTKEWAAEHIVRNYRTGKSYSQALEALKNL